MKKYCYLIMFILLQSFALGYIQSDVFRYDNNIILARSFGCIVDPSGKGDYTTIQGCLDAAPGRDVYVDKGTYTLTSRLEIYPGTKLVGCGMFCANVTQGTLQNLTQLLVNKNFDTATHDSYISITGMTFDCNVANQDYSRFAASGSHGAGLRLYTDYSVYRDIYIKNCAQFGGIVLYGRHNLFDNTWVANTRNVSNATTNAYATGIFITSVNSDHNTLINFHCRNVEGNCIYGEDYAHHTQIINPDIIGSDVGINMFQANYTSIVGGLIKDCKTRAVVFDTSYYQTMTGVNVQNCTYGISEINGADYGSYVGNNLANTRIAATDKSGGGNSYWGFNYGDSQVAASVTFTKMVNFTGIRATGMASGSQRSILLDDGTNTRWIGVAGDGSFAVRNAADSTYEFLVRDNQVDIYGSNITDTSDNVVGISDDVTIGGISGDGTGKAVCIKAGGTLGTCSDAVGAGGTCTCA